MGSWFACSDFFIFFTLKHLMQELGLVFQDKLFQILILKSIF